MEDEQIIALYWSRSEDAIHETSQKYGNSLLHLAFNIVQNGQDAEECVGDTYLQAWRAIPPHKPVCLSAFLAQITRRLAFGRLDYTRAAKRSAHLVALSQEMENCIAGLCDVEKQYEGKMITRAINDFLYTLPPIKRNVFLRRYWFADSISEIADRFEISQSKTKSMLFRVRGELREYLKKEGIFL